MDKITNLEKQIHNYNESIQAGENLTPKKACCPKCKEEVSDVVLFKYHDQRKRHVKLIVQALVKILFVILIRCKCPLCKKTFTLYPDFILPHKHYATTHVVEMCENYLEQDIRYEDVPKDGNSRITHPKPYRKAPLNAKNVVTKEDQEEQDKEESFMAGTTVYKWISWLGSLEQFLEKALELIKQISPQTEIFRKITPLHENKYKTSERKLMLEIAMRILQIKDVRIVDKKFFPDFAIGL